MSSRPVLSWALTAFLWTASIATQPSVWGQEAPAENDSLAALRDRVEASELTEEEQKAVLEVITQAEKERTETEEKVATATKLQREAESLPVQIEQAKSRLKALKDFQATLPNDRSLSKLEALLPALTAEVAKAKTALSEAESSAALLAKRRQQIEADIQRIEGELTERRGQIEAAAATTADTPLEEAQREELIISEQLLASRLQALRSEAALIDAQRAADYPQLRRDLLARELETKEEQLQAIETAIDAERAKEAAEKVESAEAQLDDLHPLLRPIGLQNQAYAEQNQELTAQIDEVENALEERVEMLDRLQKQFQQAQTRVDTVGLTEAVGAMLRNLKANLPSISQYRLRWRERQSVINDTQYDLIELVDERNTSLDFQLRQLLENAETSIPIFERDVLLNEARRLLEEQRSEFLGAVIRNQTAYFNTMVSLSTTEQQIIQLVEEATEYVNERVLWVRSTRPLTSQFTPTADEWWFTVPGAWSHVGEKVIRDIQENPFRWIFVFLLLMGLIRYRFRFRREIETIGTQVGSSAFTRFAPTLKCTMLTIAAAAPLPLLVWFLGRRLDDVAGDDQATLALSRMALAISLTYFPLELTRQVCRRKGLGISHFGWPEPQVSLVRRWLQKLILIWTPIVAATAFLGAGASTSGDDLLERYGFILAALMFAYFVGRLLHPRKGLPATFLALNPNGWASRLSLVWYPAVIAMPVSLAGLAAVGYHFSAMQLVWRIYLTICIILIAGLTVTMVLRWVLLRRRDLHISAAKAARAAREVSEGSSSEAAPALPFPTSEQSAEELRTQMVQTRRLLHTVTAAAVAIAVWLVWNDVMTARGQLEKDPLWTSTTSVTETITSDTGDVDTITRLVVDNVTIADVAFAILVVAITILATRNIPGLLEFAVLRNLPIDSSIRYAISALASYTIALLGLIVAGQNIGLHWDQVQWMATALTFGLAFGLQEMFANFVAGLIILFERPVRVGDIVEIDEVTGVVSRIRIRATTITDWNRKDYIVPNKEFITGKILNWTRSDPINRVMINVGIAYGSDTELAHRLLLETAKAQPLVLDDPAPIATFEGFGDNSLNFVLRAYLGGLDVRLPAIHQLHTEIDAAFRAAGIEISFPQRDLHLRSIPDHLLRSFNRRNGSGGSGKTAGNPTTPPPSAHEAERSAEADGNAEFDRDAEQDAEQGQAKEAEQGQESNGRSDHTSKPFG